MKKHILAFTAAAIVGGLGFAALPASAAPIAVSGLHAGDSSLTQVRMTHSEHMMMKKRMMHKKMMHRRMMKRKMMMRNGM
jgi:hypothetical protein